MFDKLGALHFYLNDHLGSARRVIAANGTPKDKYVYHPFGGESSFTVNTLQTHRYTGKPLDEEMGLDLYYYGARYYDPDLGRFTQIDPLANKYPAWGPYVYTLDNPLSNVDPDGRTGLGVLLYYLYAWGAAVATSPDLQGDVQQLTIDLSTGDYSGAACSGVGILIPAIPAAGVKAVAKGVDLAADVVKTTDEVADLAKHTDEVVDAASTGKKIHGNSLDSPKPATLYRLETKQGELLKWGMTSENPITNRYTQKYLRGKTMDIVSTGSRRNIAKAERKLVETNPGPLNREPWANER